MSKLFKNVTHVIFDLDGLLLDTERLYTEAVQNIVSKYDKIYDMSTKIQVMGLTGVEASKKIVELLELPLSWEEYYELAKEQYALLMPHAELMPDTERIYKKAIEGIAGQYGRVYTDEIRAKVVGTFETESARIAVAEMRLPITPESFLKRFKSISEKSFDNIPLMPGAERLVRHLHKQQVPIAVATSSSPGSFKLKTSKHQALFSLFHHYVLGVEVTRGKPAPDIFLLCASRFIDKPAPGKCLVFEDAPNGVTGAIEAGMQAVIVPDPKTPRDLCRHATLKLDSLEEFKPEQFGLPEFKES